MIDPNVINEIAKDIHTIASLALAIHYIIVIVACLALAGLVCGIMKK